MDIFNQIGRKRSFDNLTQSVQ